jgi:hypothetical protein
MPQLTKEQIERIVNLDEPCPRSHANLTLIRQIQFCQKMIAQEVAVCDPNAVVRTEQVARDAKGQIVYEKDGSPKIVAQTVLKRDRAGNEWRAKLVECQDSLRRWLLKSNAEHARDSEDLHRALKGEFGDRPSPDDRAAVNEFKRQFQAQHGHYQV